jgi:hypothetical protein
MRGRTVHTCDTCGHIFKKKYDFENHKARKFPCKPPYDADKKQIAVLQEELKHKVEVQTLQAQINTKNEEIIRLKTLLEDKSKDKPTNTMELRHKGSYIYLIQEREFVLNGDPVFKYGRTTSTNPAERLCKYPKDSKVVLVVSVDDCVAFEKMIRKAFLGKFKHAKEYGREYFRGDVRQMINTVMSIYNNH